MTPEFLLHLSADGIALDRRIDGDTPGWHRLGVVPLDSSNLTSDLADLRGKAGPDKSPATEVYVVLPMDQIKTMSVRALAMSRGDVAEALEGQTPYPVSQLRFDWRRHDAGSLIAAVAQDTLEEATAFAQQHQFEAVAFVALPGDDWGQDFAFFGGADVINDSSAPLKLPFVMLSDADIAPPVVAAIQPEPEPEPEIIPKAVVATPVSVAAPKIDQPAAVQAAPKVIVKPIVAPISTTNDAATVDATESAKTISPAVAATPAARGPNAMFGKDTPTPVAPAAAVKTPVPIPAKPKVAAKPKPIKTPFVTSQPKIGGKPRFLGIILTAILLLFMLAMAAWATTIGRETVARWFGIGAPETVVAQAPPTPQVDDIEITTPTIAQTPTLTDLSAMADVAAIDAAPNVEGLTSLPRVPESPDLGQSGLTQPQADSAPSFSGMGADPTPGRVVTSALGPSASAPSAPSLVQPAPPDLQNIPLVDVTPSIIEPVAPNDQIAGRNLVAPSAGALPDTSFSSVAVAPSVASAPEFSSTNVLSEDPLPRIVINNDNVNDVYTASIDPTLAASDAIALPDLRQFAPENRPATPQPHTPLDRTDSSSITNSELTSTPIVTPQGVTVRAGTPPAKPPLRDQLPEEIAPENTELTADARPNLRPENLGELVERSILGGYTRAELAAKRPTERPKSVQESASVDPTPTQSAVLTSGRPNVRPNSVVQAAKRAAAEAAALPAAVATRPSETQTPTAPSRASVTQAATVKNVLNLRRINLLGISGTSSKPSALVRLSNGRVVKVSVGSRLDGGRVSSIGKGVLVYTKSGRRVTLEIPG